MPFTNQMINDLRYSSFTLKKAGFCFRNANLNICGFVMKQSVTFTPKIMKIQKLPAEAISKLQSGIVVTDAVQCVLELVYNSLDAEATAIALRINLKNYQIQVVDNGKGIPRSDLEFVGQRFMTTKYHSLSTSKPFTLTYGFKGQAISSLLDVCQSLIIETKSDNDTSSFAKIFKKNKGSSIIESKTERHGTGTSVTVEDFMVTMPVRRKRISEVFDLEEIKSQLQNIAVIHHDVSFTLRNENKGLILFQTYPTESILHSIASIFGKSIANSLKPLNYKFKNYELSGFVSLRFWSQNNIQLLYINKRVIIRGVIHKLVNDLMKKYLENESLSNESSLEMGPTLGNVRTSSHTVFILLLRCSHSSYSLFSNLRKSTVEFRNWKDVLKCIYKGIKIAFKSDDKSLDSSSNFEEKQDDKDEEDDELKRNFGTSLLVNAVKGAPVKRRLITRDIPKKKKSKNEDVSNLESSFRNNDCKLLEVTSDKIIKEKKLVDSINDSLESPIPKNQLKPLFQERTSLYTKITLKSPNQSFIQFYEWLKMKFETDAIAFKLYKDFLRYKQRKKNIKKDGLSFHEDPTLKRKLKDKNFFIGTTTKKLKNKANEILRMSPGDNLKRRGKTLNLDKRKKLQSFQTYDLRNEKSKLLKRDAIRNRSNLYKEDNSKCGNDEDLKFVREIYKQTCKTSEKPPELIKNQNYTKFCAPHSSPAPSEIYFTNLIKFRNFSESFFCQSSYTQKQILPESKFYSSASHTWTSHYQDAFTNLAVERNVVNRKDVFTFEGKTPTYRNIDVPNNGSRIVSNLGIEYYSKGNNLNLLKSSTVPTSKVQFRDAEIQVNMSEIISAPQVDAMVRTKAPSEGSITGAVASLTILENSSFDFINIEKCNESSYNLEFNQTEHQIQLIHNIESEQISSQEVPNPDFWNLSVPETMCTVNSAAYSVDRNVDSVKKNSESIIDLPTEKDSSSELGCCGQKTGVTPQQNENSNEKDTHSLAPMWANSLADIGNSAEKSKSRSLFESSAPKSDSTQLSKTIPLEELQYFNSAPSQPVFRLTERHDFVPKGLSPKFLSTEASELIKHPTVFNLTASEKSRIKCTIDNPEYEVLSSVKWQDEQTGSSTKPTIPDGILQEMRQKVEKNMIYNENEILSASLSYCAIRVHNLLHSFVFTKELLSTVEILGQLDKKFIVAKINISSPKKMELISLFDQHAVDERIKLEEITNEYVTPDGKFVSTCLNPSINCELSKSTVRIISNSDEKIFHFGLGVEVLDDRTISIRAIPKFLMDRHEKNVRNKKNTSLMDIIQTLIVSITNEMTETRGTISKVPKIVHDVFCSEACHRAVKFNKMLTMEDMTDLINKLKNCKLPFQCAHGRPSVIPIIDLEDFKSTESEKEQIDFKKLKQFARERKRQDEFIENSDGKK